MALSTFFTLLLPIISLSQLCYFPPPISLQQSCLKFDHSKLSCEYCKPEYKKLLGQCYPHCTSGWLELMPGYCVNQTIVDQHLDFSLCPNNETVEAQGSTFECYTPTNSNCNCGPPCPPGYDSQYCECIYKMNTGLEQLNLESNVWLFVAGLFGILLALFGIIALFYQIWKRNTDKQLDQKGYEVTTNRSESLMPH